MTDAFSGRTAPDRRRRRAGRFRAPLVRIAFLALTVSAWGPGGAPSAAADGTAADRQSIEDAYMKVALYYNPGLAREEAANIVRSILYYSSPQMFNVDPRLVVAVIAVESRFRPGAVSPKGAIGLGQLMPATARGMGITNPYNIQQNVYGTVRYLREQYNRWLYHDKPLDYALAAYNAGPEAVEKHRGIPPYRETIEYVKKVKRLYRLFKYGT
ncbi:MAG: lytic transglycosylase domain-containing protein [bacterium]